MKKQKQSLYMATETDVWLGVEGVSRFHFQYDGGWILDAVEVAGGGKWIKAFIPHGASGADLSVWKKAPAAYKTPEAFRPADESHGFFSGDSRAGACLDESEGTRKQVRFIGNGWSVTYWVDETEALPWIHVKTSGITGKSVSLRTVGEGTEEGACYIGWSSYNRDSVINGSWQRHHVGCPIIAGHCLVENDTAACTDYGYLVLPENLTYYDGRYNHNSEVLVTHGTGHGLHGRYGYWALQYPDGFEQQYKCLFTLDLNISGILKAYLPDIILDAAGNDKLAKNDFYAKRERDTMLLYKDPDIYVEDEGYAPMECEYDNADGTFHRGAEFGAPRHIIPVLLFGAYAQQNKELLNFFTERIYEENLYAFFHKYNGSKDPYTPNDLGSAPFTWFIQYEAMTPFYYRLTNDYENHFIPFSQWCSFMTDSSHPERKFILDGFQVGTERDVDEAGSFWKSRVPNKTHAAAVAYDLIFHYKISGNKKMLDLAYAIMDSFINPSVSGRVEDMQDRFLAAPGKQGMCPEGVFLAAIINVERYLLTQDPLYRKYAEDFIYAGLTMYTIYPLMDARTHQGWWSELVHAEPSGQYSRGLSTGTEKDEIHEMVSCELDSCKPGAWLAWLVKHTNVPAAYPMLNIFEKEHDTIFNLKGTPEDNWHGAYMKTSQYYEGLCFHYLNEAEDKSLLLVCPDSGMMEPGVRTYRELHLYNPCPSSRTTAIFVKHLNTGSYDVYVEGERLGNLSSHELHETGLQVTVQPTQVKKIHVTANSIAEAAGTGLLAEYYKGLGHAENDYVASQVEKTVCLEDRATGINADPCSGMSVRWSGWLEAPVTGEILFEVALTGTACLYIDDRLQLRGGDPAFESRLQAKVVLAAGIKYPVRLEYACTGPTAAIGLSWSGPGLEKQLIPGRYLYPQKAASCTESSDVTYLSDLQEDFYRQFYWKSGFGCDGKGRNDPIPNPDWQLLKKDKSVDGNPLRLKGKEYAKGLGSHSKSVIEYNLHKPYNHFCADIGIDAEITSPIARGTQMPVGVAFRVYGDGKLLYKGKTMTPESEPESIKVSVRGVKKLMLMVVNNGHTKLDGHADWADARLIG